MTSVENLTTTEAAKDGQYLYLAYFLELSPGERALRGLPTSEEALAEEFGTSARNLRKWKATKSFQGIQDRVAKLKKNPLRDLPLVNMDVTGIVAAKRATPEPDLDVLDQEGPDDFVPGDQAILDSGLPDADLKRHYRELAKSDPRAMKIYMDYWGKADQARALEDSKINLDEMTLKDLVMASVEAMDPDYLVQYLAGHGWKVEKL